MVILFMIRSKVTLRIHSDELTLEDIANILGYSSALRNYSIGDMRGGRTNKKPSKYSLWSLSSDTLIPEDSDFDKHIESILDFIEKHSKKFDVVRADSDLDLFCFLSTDGSQGGAVISYELAERLADQKLNLVLDLYS